MKNFIIWLSIACIPIYGFWIFPIQEKNKETGNQLEMLGKQVQTQAEKLKSLENTQKNLKPETAEMVIKKIPATPRQELIIMELQKIAQENEFSFHALDFSKKQDSELNLPQILISFSIRGPKEKFANFLENMEQSDRFFGLETVNFQTLEVNGVPVISANLSVYTFSLE